MATPHITAGPKDFAPAVLMPGDPLRAVRIAESILDNPREVSSVRGNRAFTGTYQGKPLSVMASGMGQPSLTIYATELFREYGVKRIIRVGTCGSIADQAKVGDVVVALGAHTDSHMNRTRFPEISYAAVASWELLRAAMAVAPQVAGEAGMETAALYAVANEFHAQALTVLTVSDHLYIPGTDMSAEERERLFNNALSIAVSAALS